jgi:hypothetical protein
MQYRIKLKGSGAIVRVPEDMFPSVAQARIDGGTAERLDPAPKPEAAAIRYIRQTAMRVQPLFRIIMPTSVR